MLDAADGSSTSSSSRTGYRVSQYKYKYRVQFTCTFQFLCHFLLSQLSLLSHFPNKMEASSPSPPENLDLFHIQVYDYFVWLMNQPSSAATGRLRGQRLGESVVAALEEEFPDLLLLSSSSTTTFSPLALPLSSSHKVKTDQTPFLLLAVQHYSRQWHRQVQRTIPSIQVIKDDTRKRSREQMEGGTTSASSEALQLPSSQSPLPLPSPRSDTATASAAANAATAAKMPATNNHIRRTRNNNTSVGTTRKDSKSPTKKWIDFYREALHVVTTQPSIKFLKRELNPPLYKWLDDQNKQLAQNTNYDETRRKLLQQLNIDNLSALKNSTGRSWQKPSYTKPSSKKVPSASKPDSSVWLQRYEEAQYCESKQRPISTKLKRWIAKNKSKVRDNPESMENKVILLQNLKAWKNHPTLEELETGKEYWKDSAGNSAKLSYPSPNGKGAKGKRSSLEETNEGFDRYGIKPTKPWAQALGSRSIAATASFNPVNASVPPTPITVRNRPRTFSSDV